MNLILRRERYEAWGIVSTLESTDGDVLFYTLEHAYKNDKGLFEAKIPLGDYTCIFGIHNLDHAEGVQTYEITGIPDHKGVLFHVGNYNKDSDGCVLIGTAVGNQMITGSKTAFNKFLSLQEGKDFTLSVAA